MHERSSRYLENSLTGTTTVTKTGRAYAVGETLDEKIDEKYRAVSFRVGKVPTPSELAPEASRSIQDGGCLSPLEPKRVFPEKIRKSSSMRDELGLRDT